MAQLHLLLKISNVLVYLFFLSATVWSVVGPGPDDDTLAKHETYITPAAWVSYVWTLIHFLLGGYIITQWFDAAEDGVVHGVGWHFVIATLLNAGWLYLWTKGHLILSLIAICLVASSVSYIFYKLEADHPAMNWYTKLFIHAPFSLWHGYIVFAVVINVFATFTSVQDHGPNVLHIVLVILGLSFLGSTAVGYVEFKKQKGDILGALVIAYGLFAIFVNQQNVWIHWVAFVWGLFATLYPVRPYVAKLMGRRSSEQAPLLG